VVRDIRGEPEAGDAGWIGTHTWGRHLLGWSDVRPAGRCRIREQTKNRKAYKDALRGICRSGGNSRKLGDRHESGATRRPEPDWSDLYAKCATNPRRWTLTALWNKLGIEPNGGKDRVGSDSAAGEDTRSITRIPEASQIESVAVIRAKEAESNRFQ